MVLAWRQAVGKQLEDHPVGESEQMNREVRSADSSVDARPSRSLSTDKSVKSHLPHGDPNCLL